jgi:hypothetical protein
MGKIGEIGHDMNRIGFTLKLVRVAHIVLIGGFLSYIIYNRDSLTTYMYGAIMALGVVVFFWHSWVAYLSNELGNWPGVYYFHMFLIAPVLLYIGYSKSAKHPLVYGLLVLLTIAVIGDHSYFLLKALIQGK